MRTDMVVGAGISLYRDIHIPDPAAGVDRVARTRRQLHFDGANPGPRVHGARRVGEPQSDRACTGTRAHHPAGESGAIDVSGVGSGGELASKSGQRGVADVAADLDCDSSWYLDHIVHAAAFAVDDPGRAGIGQRELATAD